MDKKKMFYIFVILCIFILFMTFLVAKKNKISFVSNENYNMTSEDILKEKIKKNKRMLIFYYDTSYYEYNDALNIIKLYEKNYDLQFYRCNIAEVGYNSLNKILNITDNSLANVGVIAVENGSFLFTVNNMFSDELLRKNLESFKFIDAPDDNDITIMFDEFNNLYKGKNKSLIIIYQSEMELREYMFKLSKDYKFDYKIINYGVGDSFKTGTLIRESIGRDNFSVPGLYIVGNSKIYDYTSISSLDDMKKFLRKNKYM